MKEIAGEDPIPGLRPVARHMIWNTAFTSFCMQLAGQLRLSTPAVAYSMSPTQGLSPVQREGVGLKLLVYGQIIKTPRQTIQLNLPTTTTTTTTTTMKPSPMLISQDEANLCKHPALNPVSCCDLSHGIDHDSCRVPRIKALPPGSIWDPWLRSEPQRLTLHRCKARITKPLLAQQLHEHSVHQYSSCLQDGCDSVI